MRIYRRDDFMRLPEGTAYCKGKQWYFDEIQFKGETIWHEGKPIDWYAISPNWIDAHDSGEAFDRLDEMLESGTSYPLDDALCRDGVFEADDLFLVFEPADLLKLRGLIDAALAGHTAPPRGWER